MLTDEQLEALRQDSIHERFIVGSDVRRLIKELRTYKSRSEELQKALEQAKEFLGDLYSLVGQDMDINPSAKKVYLSKIAYANNTFISKALERSEQK